MLARRSDPFRDRDWSFSLNDHPRALHPEYSLDELVRKYPHLREELTGIHSRGLPINPITVKDLDSKSWRSLVKWCLLALAVILALALVI